MLQDTCPRPSRLGRRAGPGLRSAVVALLLTMALPAALRAAPPATDDPYLWLEDITGKKALDWVASQNAVSTKELAETDAFKTMNGRLLEIVNSDARIPYVTKIGGMYYNLWKDKDHERGLWRRTSLAEYRKEKPAWETVLDLDALSKAENENWVWEGVQALAPDYTRCLIQLSRGGADAHLVREFDLTGKSFVNDGFVLPEAKSDCSWKGRDAVFVGTDFGPGSMTTSGYPRIAKEWKRGTPLSAATTVYEGKASDVAVQAYHDDTPGFERDFVWRGITFYSNEMFQRQGTKLVKIEKPDDADASVHREWLLIRLRTDWTTGGKTWPAGSLLAAKLDDFVAGKREMSALLTPTDRISLDEYTTTKNAVLVNELDNVRNRLYAWTYGTSGWTRTPVAGLPEYGTVGASPVDDRDADDFWVTLTDFTTPTSLSLATVGGAQPEKLKQLPAFFDASGLDVSQHEAISKDGTRVPYFQVSPKAIKNDGNAPTILYGYGGFEVSELPAYNSLRGRGWLEQGGTFVVANIRGGGEFGPKWHQAALKANRPRAYDDFIAVGEDLVKRKVTSPRHLGCYGASNGGLLVGNMLVRRPDLFHAIVCASPLLDMKRYSNLLAGASWMGEYGNPDDPKDWAFIKTFSPYELVKKDVKYPRTLFLSSTRDDRVHPGHARKMVAKMEAQGHDVVYYENVEGGHAGAATNKQQAYMSSLTYTFFWKELAGASAAAGTVP